MHINTLILKLLEKMACLIFCVSTGVFWTLWVFRLLLLLLLLFLLFTF